MNILSKKIAGMSKKIPGIYINIVSPRICLYLTVIIILFNSVYQAEAVPGYKKISVIFGGNSDIPPYEFIDSSGSPSGFSVEITKAIAEEMGWVAEFNLSRWQDLEKKVESGKIDVIECSVFTDHRAEKYEFSIPYHEFRYSFFINTEDSENYRLHGIDGLTPVASKGSFIYEYLKKKYKRK